MIKNKKILIVGAGGFIGGHLVKRLLDDGNSIVATDIKPREYWFQEFEKAENHFSMDMKDIGNCRKVAKNVDYVFNMACNMGGMGFIENNKAECMQSVLINTNLLISCNETSVQRYFFSSSACAYNKTKQQEVFIEGLRETDAYPADPEDGYGWEKLFSERMCRHFMEDYGLQVRVARYHNIYGPFGTYDGGREKAPAALCRKIIKAKKNNKNEIEVWGDGMQTRTFLYVDDCIEGTLRLFESDYSEPVNIGSDEQVSINQMIEIIEGISGVKKLNRVYQLDKPKGVRGRSSNNDLVKKILNWSYKIKLREGLKKTYNWISSEINNQGSNLSRFTKS
ncbi:NAD-dependent epimerase/dehydratase family protein [Candidatus Pelagibacter sp.]|uniref:NAD-dependent epimerase/dehydratase family protein n=1 Tax=Candidatus Pelagibacter sp. TaxID=2024849 RepID=UPI003F858AC7